VSKISFTLLKSVITYLIAMSRNWGFSGGAEFFGKAISGDVAETKRGEKNSDNEPENQSILISLGNKEIQLL
jgi:hypothetical protein